MSRLLWTLALGVFAGALDLSILAPALPALGRDFGVQTSDLAWVFTLYLLVTVISIALAGTFADRYGRRPIYLLCISLFALGSMLAIAAPAYWVFLLARVIQALGAGGIFPVATAAIGDSVAQGRRGSALGIVAATWGLAAVIGPGFGGLVTHFIGWRWIFVVNLPLAGVVIVLALRTMPAVAARRRESLDVVGLLLLCIGLLALMDGLISTRWLIGTLGIAMLVLFAFWERTVQAPIIPFELVKTRQLIVTYVLEILIGVLEGSLFFIPTVLIGAQGLSYVAAGFIAALGAFTFVAVIPISGRALDRIGSRDVLLIGTVLTELGLAIFALGFGWLWMALLSMIVAGAGFGALLGAPTRYIVTQQTPERSRASAVGLLSQALILGQIVGSSLAGALFALSHSEIEGYRHAYLAFCAVAFVALLLAATLKPLREERRSASEEAALAL